MASWLHELDSWQALLKGCSLYTEQSLEERHFLSALRSGFGPGAYSVYETSCLYG